MQHFAGTSSTAQHVSAYFCMMQVLPWHFMNMQPAAIRLSKIDLHAHNSMQ